VKSGKLPEDLQNRDTVLQPVAFWPRWLSGPWPGDLQLPIGSPGGSGAGHSLVSASLLGNMLRDTGSGSSGKIHILHSPRQDLLNIINNQCIIVFV